MIFLLSICNLFSSVSDITASLKLFPTAIYPHHTNLQGITAENHIKIVSCVDIFLNVFGQRRQCCLLLPKMRVITVGNIHTPRRDDDDGPSQTQAQVEVDGTVYVLMQLLLAQLLLK